MIITCSNINKSFGENTVLSDISFLLNEKDKAAIIGVNGCGKTTLFKLITGELLPDSGDIIMPKGTEIGYFSQNLSIESENTIWEELSCVFDDLKEIEDRKRKIEHDMKLREGEELEELMAKYSALNDEFEKRNGFEWESRVRGVIKGLGFSDEEGSKKINTLSGGQKTRCALGRLLLMNPHILLLDEPTNHLDIESIKWLEGYLGGYNGTVIIISHDRYFIDRTTTKIIEIENGVSKVYNGNYSEYTKRKKKERENQKHRYINQQREIKKTEESIARLKSFNREKSIKRAESKEKALEKIERISKPEPLPVKMHFEFLLNRESGYNVLDVRNISKSYGSNLLFKDISFELVKGEKTALIGANGTGKTTLIKIIMGLVEADSGKAVKGSNVEIGYYDQEHNTLNPEKTVYEEIADAYPKMTETEIRNLLAAFVFKGDDVYKKVELLSGGEKGRLALAKIMLSKANLLILDEPTNHLDIYSKEILEDALTNYGGTLLFISHDRYFINKIADKVIELKDGKIKTYLGNYDYYEEKKEEQKTTPLIATKNETVKNDWQLQKEQAAEKRRAQSRLKKLEAEIAETENKIDELDRLLEKPEVATDPVKAAEAYENKVLLEEKLLGLYEELE